MNFLIDGWLLSQFGKKEKKEIAKKGEKFEIPMSQSATVEEFFHFLKKIKLYFIEMKRTAIIMRMEMTTEREHKK